MSSIFRENLHKHFHIPTNCKIDCGHDSIGTEGQAISKVGVVICPRAPNLRPESHPLFTTIQLFTRPPWISFVLLLCLFVFSHFFLIGSFPPLLLNNLGLSNFYVKFFTPKKMLVLCSSDKTTARKTVQECITLF